MMEENNIPILGAGITGLSASWVTKLPIFEAKDTPGGICASYYVRPQDKQSLHKIPEDGEAYRFEIGGGHWIFGADKEVLQFISKFALVKSYTRRSSVYFSKKNLYVPYPLQNNLRFLNKKIVERVLGEISDKFQKEPSTMKDWLSDNFGSTLCELFFYPFHNLYTANLYEQIAPQDAHKSPIDVSKVLQGANSEVDPVGYNVTFVYPKEGLNVLLQKIADKCDVRYNKRVVKIDTENKEIYFADGNAVSYHKLISTIPLNKMLEITGLKMDEKPDPYTSVLVLNIGAIRGGSYPNEHWLYIPDSKSGFHRVGFYSNVDVSFLPRSSQKDNGRVWWTEAI